MKVAIAMWMAIAVSYASEKPHVVVIVADLVEPYQVSLPAEWDRSHNQCRVSPSKAATMAAIIYGLPALQSGVVSDFDWRRHPVTSTSIFQQYQTAGYETRYFSDPAHASQLITSNTQETLPQKIGEHHNKPLFIIIQQGGCYDADFISTSLQQIVENSSRPMVVGALSLMNPTIDSKRGFIPEKYHYPAKWSFFQQGVHFEVSGHLIDFQLNQLLTDILKGEKKIVIQEPKHHFFHRANWPPQESSEKYRHRDSLVISDGYALVDGLELYPATPDLEPDLSQPLDISRHTRRHSELLTRHNQWWQVAREALTNKRAFPVGQENGMVTKLTALDWRPSNIIHPDDSSPSSKPLVYEHDLKTILEGLKNESYRETFPAYCGSWAVDILQAGRYQVTMGKLPPNQKSDLAKLAAGRAFIKLGQSKVELAIPTNTSSISINIDAEAGVTDLECWFTGQLPLERELGAFFVEIKRVGEKKYNLTPP
ncbi:MAG: hypothetical protein ACSHX0_08865 [Akkermansiaceae bacterium]